MRQVSTAESYVCTRLRPILAALNPRAEIDDSNELRDALSAIEWFLPEVLGEIHSEWKGESLDGIYPAIAQKLGENEIEIVGLCCLLIDQTLAPLHLRLQLDTTEDAISWLECRVGESEGNGMRRVPYSQGIVYGHKAKPQVLKRLDSIEWAYCVGYGERRAGKESNGDKNKLGNNSEA